MQKSSETPYAVRLHCFFPWQTRDEEADSLVANLRTMQKDINEQYALYWKNIFGLDVTVLRFSTVYGPGQLPEHGVVSRLLHAALYREPFRFNGSELQTRDFLYIDDAAFAVYQAAVRKYNPSLPRNDKIKV